MSVGVGAELSRDESFFKQFPIHRACRDGDLMALMSLLEQLSNQAHLTAEDSCYGWTPIHWAAHYGQLECVVHLVQMGCEVNTVTSRFNQTPTHTAAFGGHPHCVVWLTQAGADINRQDCVGEAPIHKAARSGSLECVQVLLIAGAEPQLRNASGQTAADLAQAHGFHDCFCIISNAQTQLVQLGVLRDCAPCGQEQHCRKRQLTQKENHHMKKARRAEVLVQSSVGDEVETMSMESDANTKAFLGVHQLTPPSENTHSEQRRHSLPSPAEMCGSLHLTGSSGSNRPEHWWLTGADSGDSLLYGHYHGFGDTAEDLSDSGCRQPLTSTVHLYHGS
ncbi:ankyrin repeat domain-containing protein 10a [Poeciliopsis prolifica]|uniref:ankyrin repeat domain-containing protein 10a n=1 Tax=Poeciliopsis prolifica TaxID=188132 RepID=UPI00072CECBC|nr:ankyrin repeat domain-containing protein 10a [Poeciliopsis prolifica]